MYTVHRRDWQEFSSQYWPHRNEPREMVKLTDISLNIIYLQTKPFTRTIYLTIQNLQYSTTYFLRLIYKQTTFDRWTHFTLTWHTKRMVRTTLTCFNRQTLMIPKASDNMVKIYSHVTATFQFYSQDFCRKSLRGN